MAQVPSGDWKHPAVRAMPLPKDEVASAVEVMAPAPVRASPFPARERPDEEKVEVADPTMERRVASRRSATSRSPARVEVPAPDPKN